MQLVFKLRQVHCPKQRNQLNGIIRPIVLVLRLQIVPTFQNLLAGSELLLAMICLRIDGLGRLSSFLRQPVGYNTVYFFLRERPAAAQIPICILRLVGFCSVFWFIVSSLMVYLRFTPRVG